MNKARPSERWIRLLALAFSIFPYAALIWGVGFWADRLLNEDPPAVSVNAVNLSFSQMELVKIEETPPPKEPEPLPLLEEPDPLPPPDEVDVVLEEVTKEPKPEPEIAEPEPVQAEAQVTQEASAPEVEVVNTDRLMAWVSWQVEKEKYYPKVAQRAGYEGTFHVVVRIEADGTISAAVISSGEGHPLLRRSLEKIAASLLGRSFGQPLDEAISFDIPVDYKLE